MSDEDDQSTVRAITKSKLLKIAKAVADNNKAVGELRLELAEKYEDAVEAGLHKAAFKVALQADKILKDRGAAALTEFWFCVDSYRDMLGHNDHRELPLRGDDESEDPDFEGEEDLRPRHLRQPDATGH